MLRLLSHRPHSSNSSYVKFLLKRSSYFSYSDVPQLIERLFVFPLGGFLLKIQMKALILAAGHGSRLRPLTNSIPKCLVEIDGKPLLQRWLEALESIGCELAIVNTHYLSTMVEDFLKDWKSDVLKVETKYEQKLLGGSRTLLQCRSEIEGDITLLIHADNMMEESLDGLIQAFNNRPNFCPITMLTFHTDYKEECGIVEIDSNGVVVNFHEKKKDAPGNLANGAVYAL